MVALLAAGCGAAGSTTSAGQPIRPPAVSGGLSYKPPVVPLKFTVNTNGQLSVSLDRTIVTPIGEFSLDGAAEFSAAPEDDCTLVVLKDTRIAQPIYCIKRSALDGEGLVVKVDGKSTFEIKGNEIDIDTSQAGSVVQ